MIEFPVLNFKNYSKLLLSVFCGIIFILGFQLGGLQLALLRAVMDLNLYGAMMGLPVTVQFAAISVTPLIFGPISDRVGKKKILAIFMAVFAVGSFVTFLSGTAFLFLTGLFIIGAGYSVCECTVTAAITDIFDRDGEKYINFSQSFFCVGAAVSPLILQMLMDNFNFSWRMVFLICAIVMAAIIPIFWLAHPTVVSAPKDTLTRPKSTTTHSPRINLIIFIACMAVYSGVESSVSSFADTVFSLELNSPYLGAYAIFSFWAAMGLGRFVFGRLKKIPPYSTAISLLCSAIILVAIVFSSSQMFVLALFAAAGFACACVWPGIVSLAVNTHKEASGTVMSYMNLGGGAGGALFPFIMGVVMETYGLSYAFLGLAVLAMVASIIIYRTS